VQDSGTGIEAADLEHIFERFATGSPAVGRRGTGLGLALVRAVAEGHGGEVRAQSTPGLGSRFELLLPVAPAAIPAAGQGSRPAALPAGNSWGSNL
jgi:signal transduction histidine kinase